MSPRDFSLDPTGTNILVANQYSDYVNILGVNRETGRLRRMRRVLKVNAASAVLFVEDSNAK
jgi:6-phosphogluconolactonase (cycloisomerase 2 family)